MMWSGGYNAYSIIISITCMHNFCNLMTHFLSPTLHTLFFLSKSSIPPLSLHLSFFLPVTYCLFYSTLILHRLLYLDKVQSIIKSMPAQLKMYESFFKKLKVELPYEPAIHSFIYIQRKRNPSAEVIPLLL
jgi:hypothetical protein